MYKREEGVNHEVAGANMILLLVFIHCFCFCFDDDDGGEHCLAFQSKISHLDSVGLRAGDYEGHST